MKYLVLLELTLLSLPKHLSVWKDYIATVGLRRFQTSSPVPAPADLEHVKLVKLDNWRRMNIDMRILLFVQDSFSYVTFTQEQVMGTANIALT